MIGARDIPIIFSAPMVLALLREAKKPGTGKTMTRRLAWRELNTNVKGRIAAGLGKSPSPWQRVKPGDRLWVRENIGRRVAITLLGTPAKNGVEEAVYAADDSEVVNEDGFNLCPWWKSKGILPCIHMPRRVSRLTLVVTATKIECVQSITDADCIAEGANGKIIGPTGQPMLRRGGNVSHGRDALRHWYRNLWDNLHRSDHSWYANPEVIALSFTVHRSNIDALPKAA